MNKLICFIIGHKENHDYCCDRCGLSEYYNEMFATIPTYFYSLKSRIIRLFDNKKYCKDCKEKIYDCNCLPF